jgi:hypothetical protein
MDIVVTNTYLNVIIPISVHSILTFPLNDVDITILCPIAVYYLRYAVT